MTNFCLFIKHVFYHRTLSKTPAGELISFQRARWKGRMDQDPNPLESIRITDQG
jgi:hypothetical protein